MNVANQRRDFALKSGKVEKRNFLLHATGFPIGATGFPIGAMGFPIGAKTERRAEGGQSTKHKNSQNRAEG